MSIAGELARFLVGTRAGDLPPLALERARMVIASTVASAAMGKDIVSARIIRELARERGGAEDASVWFDGGAGYRGSRPVRIGNLAVRQRQLDVYGEVIDAVSYSCREGSRIDRETQAMLRGFGDFV